MLRVENQTVSARTVFVFASPALNRRKFATELSGADERKRKEGLQPLLSYPTSPADNLAIHIIGRSPTWALRSSQADIAVINSPLRSLALDASVTTFHCFGGAHASTCCAQFSEDATHQLSFAIARTRHVGDDLALVWWRICKCVLREIFLGFCRDA